ncbi:MAG: bifunctional nuclease family protein [Chitinophagaceae bacterium]|nr:bifunctional nuclease family protein [Chitinophagaceae bacterium]
MEKIELEIVALSHSITQNNSYAIVLRELNGQRKMPIVIGAFEAQAIAVALEKMQPTRPLTHDLFYGFMNTFNIELVEIIVYKLDDGIFYSKLVCLQANDQVIEIDSRTSDALALAVRANCRIFTYDTVIEAASIFLNDENRPNKRAIQASGPSAKMGAEEDKEEDNLQKMSLSELNALLQKVLEQEDYVLAIEIRDEIQARISNKS